jgi:8-oxo-dGTP pyrophosphatase MutT (NUDIX family)
MNWPGRRVGAAAVILDERGYVLLVRHTYGRLNWELPGGASEPGESVVETALREVREETGLKVKAERLTGIYYDPEQDAHHFVFRCRTVDGAAPVPGSEEISACAFCAPDDAPRPISDFTLRRIRDAVAHDPQVLPESVPQRSWLE